MTKMRPDKQMKFAKKLNDVNLYDAPKDAPPRSVAVTIDTGNPEELTMGLFVLPAGKKSEYDYHDIDEAYYITRGKGYGLLWVHGENKDPERYEVEPGTSVLVPAGAKHHMVNTGSEDIWLVWFFPRHPKVAGRLQSKPFSPETWIKRTTALTDEWLPKV